MNSNSLQSFFDNADAVSLDTCDTEAIHRSGAVQRTAIFFAVHPQTLKISHWSNNAAAMGFIGSHADTLHDYPIEKLLPDLAQEVRELAQDADSANQHIALSEPVEADGQDYDAIFCHVGEAIFIELLPAANITPRWLKTKLRATQRATANILSAKDFQTSQDIAAAAIQSLTGYDRIKIYQFQPDESGKVNAEARVEKMPSYLGLHFPASDIPKQARHLFSLLPFRAISSVDDQINPIMTADGPAMGQLDLTWSIGRSVSTMHTAYLRNMGVGGSFSSALMDRGQLWGLIACHHSEPHDLPFDIWGLIHDIADTLMVKLNQERDRETAAKIAKMRDLEADVAVRLRERGTIEEVLSEYSKPLMDFLEADGFAFQFDNNVYSTGKVPPKPFIRQLIKWVGSNSTNTDYFHSDAMHRQWPEAKQFMDTACGVLIQPVIIYRVCQLVWFRGPVTSKVHWAGDPTPQKMTTRVDGLDVLQPRNSFAQWVDEHREQSLAWTTAEISAASEIFKEVLDIIASQAQGLKRMTEELTLSQAETREELAQFAYAAAHDIQNPINTITSALELMKSTQGKDVDPMVEKSMDFAIRSSDRLRNLADQMANFVALGRREIDPEIVPLDEVVSDTLKMLDHAIEECGASFDIPQLPTVAGNRDLLTILFLNLFSNALKYRDPNRKPHIRLTTESKEQFAQLAIEDNGMGIAAADADKIFKAFQRLHRADEIPGSGLGLATCKKIAELHKTSLIFDTDYTGGARFTMDLRKRLWTKGPLN